MSRYIATCKACKTHMSTEARDLNTVGEQLGALVRSDRFFWAIPCRSCGQERKARLVRGTYNPAHKCNAKCLASHGHVCDCSCGGRNHGTAWA